MSWSDNHTLKNIVLEDIELEKSKDKISDE